MQLDDHRPGDYPPYYAAAPALGWAGSLVASAPVFDVIDGVRPQAGNWRSWGWSASPTLGWMRPSGTGGCLCARWVCGWAPSFRGGDPTHRALCARIVDIPDIRAFPLLIRPLFQEVHEGATYSCEDVLALFDHGD